ncbi:MAG: T9SS type A sorting domain-containing protein [Sphingobacteriales bacterium]|nr:T9SS type A sorting domain-containing protein [Sphingobacteriales bacterium]
MHLFHRLTYQWQTNLGLGFQNISNAGQYTGTDKDTLKVLNAALSNNNQQFRCIISSGGCSDTTNTVVLTVNNSTGINQSISEQSFSVYPNPASGDVLLKTTRKYVGNMYTIRNLLGQILLSNKIMYETTIVRLNGLEKGVYFIQVGEDLKRTVKLIKE